MILVIDGFNLIYKFPQLEELMYNSQLDSARAGLLTMLEKFQKAQKNLTIYVFFDGKKGTGSTVIEDLHGKMKIHYSQELTADHYIKLFIKANPNPSNLTVVSSDKDILGFCKRYSAKIQKSEDFAKWVESSFQIEKNVDEKDSVVNLSEEEVEYWHNLFLRKK